MAGSWDAIVIGAGEFIPAEHVIFNIPIQEPFSYISEYALPGDTLAGIKSP